MWQYTLCWNITMSRCISFKLCFTFRQFSWQPETLSRQKGCLLANLATLRCNNCLIYKFQSFLSFIYFRHQLLQTLPHQKAVPRLPPNAVAQRWEFQIVQGFPNLNFNCQKKFSPTFWGDCWGLHWFGAKSNLSQFMYFCVKQKFTPKSCSRSKYHVNIMYARKYFSPILLNQVPVEECLLAARNSLKGASQRRSAGRPGNVKVRQFQNSVVLKVCKPFHILIFAGSSFCRFFHARKLQVCHQSQQF